MDDALVLASKIATLTFVVASMAASGLGLGVKELLAPLSRARLVIMSLAANFLIAPALAYALTKLFMLYEPYETGLLLLGGAAGAPFLPKLATLAKGDGAFAVGLMLLLMVGSVIFMPLALPLMIPGLNAEPWPILKPLLFTMLLPLSVGMIVRGRNKQVAAKLQPIIEAISSLSMILTLSLLIGLNFSTMLGTFGTGAALLGALFVAQMFLAGFALGGPMLTTRITLGVGAGQRNAPAALLVATQNFTDPAVAIMLIVTTLAGIVVLLIAVRIIHRTTP